MASRPADTGDQVQIAELTRRDRMRPFEQADPKVQLMLVERGDRTAARPRDHAPRPRSVRRRLVRAALAAGAVSVAVALVTVGPAMAAPAEKKVAPRAHWGNADPKVHYGKLAPHHIARTRTARSHSR
ncbi:MAG: hypothetical protein ACXVFL_17855 [Solirubrobacteraceae bacterium]